MFLKSVSSKIPGFRGEPGKLIKTSEILDNIKHDAQGNDFCSKFIKRMIGIESVAFSECSINYFRDQKIKRNNSIYSLLHSCIEDALKNDADNTKITTHIHISGPTEPVIEHRIGDIRKDLGIDVPSTIILQQGCAGLIDALNIAKKMVEGDEGALITCDNNTMPYAHNRARRFAHRKNIEEWLWSSMMGDAVGAMVVANTTKSDALKLEDIERLQATDEWRVREFNDDKSTPVLKMRAGSVKNTYLSNVKKITSIGIEKAGGLDNTAKVLLHESNPLMVKKIARELQISDDKISSFSSKTGSIAAVSAFTLLEDARNNFKLNTPKGDRIVLSVIGETSTGVVAGVINFKWNKKVKL